MSHSKVSYARDRSFEPRPFKTQLTQILLRTGKTLYRLKPRWTGRHCRTLLYTQILQACREEDWTRAKVQINSSSLQSLRKISVEQELNSWQQQVLLRKKNRQLLEQISQLKPLKHSGKPDRQTSACSSITRQRSKTISKKYTNTISQAVSAQILNIISMNATICYKEWFIVCEPHTIK